MNKFYVFILSFLFLSIAFSAEKSGCIDGKIRFLNRDKTEEIKERYCYDSVVKSISSVRKCGEHQEKECLINMPGPFPMKMKDVQSEKGSVGFKVCENLKGKPQFIEYWDGESWIKTSRCIFEDGSYMDISALTLKVKYE